MSEAELQKKVNKYLDDNKITYLHFPQAAGKKRGQLKKGWPDLTIIGKCVFFVELKSKGGKIRPEQEDFYYVCKFFKIPMLITWDYEEAIKFIKNNI